MAPPQKESETMYFEGASARNQANEPLLSRRNRDSPRRTSSLLKTFSLVVLGALIITLSLVVLRIFSMRKHDQNPIFTLLNGLDADMEGRIYFPDTPHFADAARVWREDMPPPLVVIEPVNEEDVRKAVLALGQLSTRYSFPFRIRSGGHSKAGYSTVEGGAVLSLTRMNRVELLEENGTAAIARIQPGARTEHVLDTLLLPRGYGGVVGICGRVAEGGFVLGGGVGFMSRLLGMGVDQVHEMRVVVADGSVVVANNERQQQPEEEASSNSNTTVTPSDLFWALRGAGSGNFGVVTEIKYQLYAVQNNQTFVMLNIPIDGIWQFAYELGKANLRGEFNGDFGGRVGDESITAYLSYFGFGPSPVEEGREFFQTKISPMLPSGTPPMNITVYPWDEGAHFLGDYGYGKKVWAAQCWGGFLFADNNTKEVWAEIGSILTSGMKESPNVDPHIELWGGAISDVDVSATAFPYREAIFNIGVLLVIPEPGENAERSFHDQIDKVNAWWPMVAKHLTGVYLNYPMASMDRDEYPRAYWGKHLERLVDIKRQVDPNNIFSYEQSMPLSVPK